METLFVVFVSVIAGGAAVAIYNYIRSLTERIKELERKAAASKRLPYKSADAENDPPSPEIRSFCMWACAQNNAS